MSAGGRDSRVVAVLLSALACPGAGQVYKRNYLRGGLLIAASLAVVAAVVARTMAAMFEMTMGMPPEQVMLDVFGLAHRIMESSSAFFSLTGYIFLALWIYGVADAALAKPGRPRVRSLPRD